ncbi:hypothetical protein ACVWW6_005554 [Bradyrhizobium sp. USDA 3311]
MTVVTLKPKRQHDGRFAAELPPAICSFHEAWVSYHSYLAAVCTHQGLSLRDVGKQLAREGRINVDPEWRRAVYARQLALYLTNTTLNVPQAWLGDIAGITRAGVCLALKAIEDLRDNGDFDVRIDLIAAELAAHTMVHERSAELGQRARNVQSALEAGR